MAPVAVAAAIAMLFIILGVSEYMVYVEGFGWITDEGEGSGIYADDMYENGNKIGIMD